MFQRILVPVDGSDTSELAVRTAARLARESGGRIRLMHVLDQTVFMAGYDPAGGASGQMFGALRDSARQILREAEAVIASDGVPCESELVDEPGKRLADSVADAAQAWQADLIVVGTHGRRGPSRLFLGSGAEQIIRGAPVPVLVVRDHRGR